MSSRETEQRRAEIYRLHLVGLSLDEIAKSLQIDKAAVSRHITAMRAQGLWTGRNHRQLYNDIMQESYDAARLSMAQAWKMYNDAKSSGDKANALSRVQAGIKLVLEIRPDLEALWMQENLDFVKDRQEEALALQDETIAMKARVQRLERERDMKSRVLPVSPDSEEQI